MVQKQPAARRRGRPPAYDADVALGRAMEVFWVNGYAATSLDDIAAATGMNRPSLYGAFGDKRTIYLKALAHYGEMISRAVRGAMAPGRPLRAGLDAVFASVLDVYFDGPKARGCFVVGTAITEACGNAEVREALAGGLRQLDAAFEQRFRQAREAGELSPAVDPAAAAKLVSAILYSAAIRARAGDSRSCLEAMVRDTLDLICPRRPA